MSIWRRSLFSNYFVESCVARHCVHVAGVVAATEISFAASLATEADARNEVATRDCAWCRGWN